MPGLDGTGQAGSEPRDGRGQGVVGKEQRSTRKGQGAMSGGKKGGCKQKAIGPSPYYRPTATRVFPLFKTYLLGLRPRSELCARPSL